jgi:hypothetical protein
MIQPTINCKSRKRNTNAKKQQRESSLGKKNTEHKRENVIKNRKIKILMTFRRRMALQKFIETAQGKVQRTSNLEIVEF